MHPVGRDGQAGAARTGRTVDVVVPCYNYGRYLRRCLDSVLTQEGVSPRVLVIDDASSDGSADVAARLADADPRVHLRVHAENAGHIATYNEGLLGWVEADYCVLLSADDLLPPGALGRAVDLLASRPGAGLVYGWSAYFSDESRLPRVPRTQRGTTVWAGWDWVEQRCRTATNVISSPEVVMRTEVQHRVGGYRPELPHAGDLEMWLRVAAVSDIGYVRGAPQAFYRVHPGSMQRTVFDASLADQRQRWEVFARFLAEHEPPGGQAHRARLLSLAGTALAREVLWSAARSYDRGETDEAPVRAMVDFALEVCPDAASLPEHRALLRRRRLGAAFCHRTQVFAPSGAVRRARRMYRFERWKRTGT